MPALKYWDGTAWQYLTGGGVGQPTRVGCEVYQSVAQSLTQNTWTALSWNIAISDSGGFFPGSNNNYVRIPLGQSGVYALNTYLYAGNLGANCQLGFWRNAGGVIYRKAITPNMDSLTWVGWLNEYDYVQVVIYCPNAGISTTIESVGANNPYAPLFNVFKVS